MKPATNPRAAVTPESGNIPVASVIRLGTYTETIENSCEPKLVKEGVIPETKYNAMVKTIKITETAMPLLRRIPRSKKITNPPTSITMPFIVRMSEGLIVKLIWSPPS